MKYMSLIMILSLIHYCLGCYSTNIIKQNSENQIATKETILENSNKGTYIFTRDSAKYYFHPKTYEIKGIVFQGKGQKFYQGQRLVGEYDIKIELKNI